MAGTFTATGSYSNLTRLELEQLRKADFYAGLKALTVGDSALPPEGVVGPGSVNAEPYLTGPSVLFADVYSLTPPTQPGTALGASAETSDLVAETVKWYGPTHRLSGINGVVTSGGSPAVLTDTQVNFVTAGVVAGDILLLNQQGPGQTNANQYATAVVTIVAATTITVNNINNTFAGGGTSLVADTNAYRYVIVKPNAVQLFAVPASGATGFEQTFMAVIPGSTLHSNVAPTVDQINADRVKNLVPTQYALNTGVDRADSVFASPAPGTGLDKLGYRIVLYTDNGLGTGPNLSNPVATLNPVIDPAIPITDQRMTVDEKAGIIRFSCEPKIGGQIKVTGGTNPTTGRLNLYAVFFSVDQTLTQNTAAGLYVQRSSNFTPDIPARIFFNQTYTQVRCTLTFSAPLVGTTITPGQLVANVNGTSLTFTNLNSFVAAATNTGIVFQALTIGPTPAIGPETLTVITKPLTGWNSILNPASQFQLGTAAWGFVRQPLAGPSDGTHTQDLDLADKTALTVGDGTNPPQAPGGDFLTPGTASAGLSAPGARDASLSLHEALNSAFVKGYGSVHLRRGQYMFTNLGIHPGGPQAGGAFPITIPPGITIEGEGDTTVVRGWGNSIFKMGPNTSWRVYDPDVFPFTKGGTQVDELAPSTVFDWSTLSASELLEGVDVVWNPVRRCWGIVQAAITTSQGIYFNEIFPDGTRAIAGLGLNLKTSAHNLWNTSIVGSAYTTRDHTRSHYPRIAYSPKTDEYVVVWVEDVGAGVGPRVNMNMVQTTSLNPVTLARKFPASITFQATTGAPFTTGYSDHPSVACDQGAVGFSTFGTPTFCVAFYSVSPTNTTQNAAAAASVQVWNMDGVTNYFHADQQTLSTLIPTDNPGPVSSIDVDADPFGNYQVVWSEHDHPLLISKTGTIDASSHLQDAAFLATYTPATWVGTGVGVNSQFLPLSPTGIGTIAGLDGFIVDNPITGTNLTVQLNATGGTYPATVGLSWALAPVSTVHGLMVARTADTTWTPNSQQDFTVTATLPLTTYTQSPRELDYVRVSYGNGQWLVACQALNTTSWLSFGGWNPFDPFNTAFPENAAPLNSVIAMQSGWPSRHHISTVGFILTANGVLSDKIIPQYNTNFQLNTADSEFQNNGKRDLYNSNLSLGTRGPSMPWFNNQKDTALNREVPQGFAFQISARNFHYKWGSVSPGPATAGPPPSILPDITWTGSDWVVVSPTHNTIHSDTGVYWTPDAVNFYLSDITFYFGNGQSNLIDGNFLRDTTGGPLAGALGGIFQIYIPGATTQYQAFTVVDEHTIQFTGAVAPFPSAAGNVTHNIEWFLILNDPLNLASPLALPGSLKNLGYRVSPDGRVIVSSVYTTMADEVPDDGLGNGLTNLFKTPILDETAYNLGLTPSFINVGDQPSDNHWPYYSTSRYEYDVGFRGVAVGLPKPCNEVPALEQPMCAIAWGDNFYGFLDRYVGGNPGVRSNATIFSRQSFGPFRNGIKDMRLEQPEYFNTTQNPNIGPPNMLLTVNTRQPVWTRHGAPALATGGFATDGFRNFFAAPGIRSVTGLPSATNPPNTYDFTLDMYYTDALGRYPIRVSSIDVTKMNFAAGSTAAQGNMQWMSDIASNQPIVGTFSKWHPLNPGAPVVIWNGTNPVVFFAVSPLSTIAAGFQGQVRQVFIAAANLAGGEDTERAPTWELTQDIDTDWFVSEVARISCGTGNLQVAPTFLSEPTTQIDAAFSGKTYAVLWCAGQNPGSDTNLGHCVVGITLYTNTGVQGVLFGTAVGGSAATYTLDAIYSPPATRAVFLSPKILWDGKQFVATWVTARGGSTPQITTVAMPEFGFATPQVTKQAVAPFQNLTPTSIGTMSQTSGTSTNFILLNVGVHAQPGDIIHVIDAVNGPPVTGQSLRGSYTVIEVESGAAERSQAYVAVSPTAVPVPAGTTFLYGFITSGGVSRQNNVTGPNEVMNEDISPWGNQQSTNPIAMYWPGGSLVNQPFSMTGASLQYITKISGFVYDAERDVYTIMFLGQNGGGNINLSMIQYTRGSYTLHTEVPITAGAGPTGVVAASLGWNGRHYLVAIGTGGVGLEYFLLTPKLQIVEAGLIDPLGNPPNLADLAISNSPGSKPGPLYGPLVASPTSIMQPIVRNTHVKWNNRLNRWIVSASYLWSTDESNGLTSGEINWSVATLINVGGPTVVSWVNKTLTLSAPSNLIQVGCRLAWVQSPNFLTTMTVMAVSGAVLTVDLPSTESAHTAAIVSPGTATALVIPREDVFCWTLSYNFPAVQLQDADETFIDNVTFTGAVDIEEKYLRMATPTWQAAGIPQAKLTSFTQRHGALYNHMFLTPTTKVETVRLTNVRSRTSVKYGYGMLSGAPTMDRYVFNVVNRRS